MRLPAGRIKSIHYVPQNDLVEHRTEDDGECICGPSAQIIKDAGDADVWEYTHHSLDGREGKSRHGRL